MSYDVLMPDWSYEPGLFRLISQHTTYLTTVASISGLSYDSKKIQLQVDVHVTFEELNESEPKFTL